MRIVADNGASLNRDIEVSECTEAPSVLQKLIGKDAQMSSELKAAFEAEAEWRAEKATEYSQDARNARAAVILRRLAATADGVPQELVAAYDALFLRFDTHEVIRLHTDALRAVGFHTYPADATAFVREFIELVNADRRRFEGGRHLGLVGR